MLLPRSNPNAMFDLSVTPLIVGVGRTDDVEKADRVAVEISWGNGNQRRQVSLLKEEVDDLIVMLTYYKGKVFDDT